MLLQEPLHPSCCGHMWKLSATLHESLERPLQNRERGRGERERERERESRRGAEERVTEREKGERAIDRETDGQSKKQKERWRESNSGWRKRDGAMETSGKRMTDIKMKGG